MGWQDAIVALAVLAAVAYLASRFVGPRRARASTRPDVRATALVRRRTGTAPRA